MGGDAADTRIPRARDTGGPNSVADRLMDEIDDLNAQLEELRGRARKPLNKRLHRLKELLAWCETRAGYVAGLGE